MSRDQVVLGSGGEFDRYLVRRLVEDDGASEYHVAFDRVVGRDVCLRVAPRRDIGAEPGDPVWEDACARLAFEATVLGQLAHGGLPWVHDMGETPDGRAFVAMRLLPERTLEDELRDLGAERGVACLAGACDALAHAHDHGVLHRNLSPRAIRVADSGDVLVSRWSVLRLQRANRIEWRGRQAPAVVLAEVDGTVVGNPTYMAPEQARGDLDRIGPRSDVYAVGAILYRLLTGRVPFHRRTREPDPIELLVAKTEGEPRPVRECAPRAPADLTAICERAMAKDPEERYADMSALRDDLTNHLQGRPVDALPAGRMAGARAWVGRKLGRADATARRGG